MEISGTLNITPEYPCFPKSACRPLEAGLKILWYIRFAGLGAGTWRHASFDLGRTFDASATGTVRSISLSFYLSVHRTIGPTADKYHPVYYYIPKGSRFVNQEVQLKGPLSRCPLRTWQSKKSDVRVLEPKRGIRGTLETGQRLHKVTFCARRRLELTNGLETFRGADRVSGWVFGREVLVRYGATGLVKKAQPGKKLLDTWLVRI